MRQATCAVMMFGAVLLCDVGVWAKPHALAIVVGNNQPSGGDLDPLRFADDDAFRYADYFRYVAQDVLLLARADQESSALYPGDPPLPPTRSNVLDAIDGSVAKAEEHASAGDDVVVYFVFSGHGSYDAEGRGFLHLEDGKLTTRDLFYHLISRSTSFRLVLVVDACNAGFLVKSRGETAVRRPAGPPTLEMESYENVGLVLSSSSTGEVKEWGRYLAGIFSHQVRSALTGAADADGDSRITFQELASFAAAANAKVDNPALKLTPYIRPPLSTPDMPLVDLSIAAFPATLNISLDEPAKVTIYRQNMVRIADFNLSARHTVQVALATSTEHYVVVGEKTEYLVPDGLFGIFELDSLEKREPVEVSSRGVDQYYLERLFQVPYDRDFAAQYLSGPYQSSLIFERSYEKPWWDNSLGWSLSGLSLALLGVSGAFYYQAADERVAALSTPWADEKASHNSTISKYNDISLASAIAGGVSAAGAAALFLFDRPTESVRIEPKVGPGIDIRPAPGGAVVEGRF